MFQKPRAKLLSGFVVIFVMLGCTAITNVSLASGKATQETLSTLLQAPKAPPTAYLQILASVGPLEYLSGAEVTVKDSVGTVVSKGKTNSRGSVVFPLSRQRLAVAFRPLRFTTSGGQVIEQKGNQTSGPLFHGQLQGQISKVPLGKHTIAYLDLISTSASVMKSKRKTYDSSVKAVRDALSIGRGFPVNGIRFKNNYVGAPQLQAATQAYGGYDRYVRNMVNRIRLGEKITELTPPIYSKTANPAKSAPSEALTNALRPYEAKSLQAQTSEATSAFPQCNVPLSNGSNTSASTEIIEDFGVTSIKILLQYAGFPSAAANGLAGMVLTGGASGSPSTSSLQAVDEQLSCISSQINTLVTLVDALTLTTDVDQNTECGNQVVYQLGLYSGLVAMAQDCDTPNCQMNSNNPSLLADLPGWSPSSDLVDGICAGPTGTNNMLFGSGGGQGAAWLQLNSNYQNTAGGYAWYTALQVQQLQEFLSYWGSIEYNLFVLTNEYNNYYQLFENAQIASGNVPGSQTVCTSGSTNLTATYCVGQSNIANAYPPDLYSDEIGIWNNSIGTGAGLAVNAFPAGLTMTYDYPNGAGPGGQRGLNPYMLFYNTPQNSTWSANASSPSASNYNVPSEGATTASYSAFNSYGINPNGLPSAIEQFSNPQALRTIQPTSAQVASLVSNNYYQQGTSGTTSWSFFVDAINQSPPSGYSFPIASEWTGLTPTSSTSNGTGFYTADNISDFSVVSADGSSCNGGTSECLKTSDSFNNTIGPYAYNDTTHGSSKTPATEGNIPSLARFWVEPGGRLIAPITPL